MALPIDRVVVDYVCPLNTTPDGTKPIEFSYDFAETLQGVASVRIVSWSVTRVADYTNTDVDNGPAFWSLGTPQDPAYLLYTTSAAMTAETVVAGQSVPAMPVWLSTSGFNSQVLPEPWEVLKVRTGPVALSRLNFQLKRMPLPNDAPVEYTAERAARPHPAIGRITLMLEVRRVSEARVQLNSLTQPVAGPWVAASSDVERIGQDYYDERKNSNLNDVRAATSRAQFADWAKRSLLPP